MVGDEGGNGSLPEGAILHLKSVPPGLSGEALEIATALHDFGAVVGDADPNLSDPSAFLNLEPLNLDAPSFSWDSSFTEDALSSLPLTDANFEFRPCPAGRPGARGSGGRAHGCGLVSLSGTT